MTERKHEKLGLDRDQLIDMFKTMLSARKIDERMWLLNRAGKIPFVVSCQGHEAAQAGAVMALDTDKDYLLPYYRDVGMVLHFGMTVKDLMLQGFAKAEDPNSGGRQMPNHFGSKNHRIVTGSSPVTTQLPHAVGIALAGRIKNDPFVCLTSFGEGSSNQGDFHEAANFAGVHRLPVIFFCENNQYAISVPVDRQIACERVSDRASSYGMHGETVDGNDPLAVYEAVKKAADHARAGGGPSLIESLSYRLTPHSSDDDDRSYRERDEVDDAKKKDGILTFADYLKGYDLLTDAEEKNIHEQIQKSIDEATDAAEKAAYAEAESTLNHVYHQ
ncbi:thiamine pyrophosphate-dependent dehydrogenase E1 component subunit alpha [Salicibibacter halophilus]|uniref:2-oxoisovalerate dehydrogenase subunit alpha n=1 Tax=Salicibibacter halophilus TaxID=2502791 RepID=A0A514LDG5_9BACI|nr:thiamine pyrophosphate-dependent dehydrogenase E1 component subunit alpha [Salicibibacter halophilus]QDI89880.1 thiamine pyrophosphate-dependent dehydrogenase E1 component subunit alpha [Salicibibacter halophilus]